MAGLLYRLGRFSARRHWVVIISWFVLIALAFVAFSMFKGTVTTAITIPGTATSKVTDELSAKFPAASGGSGNIIFATTDGKAFTASQKSEIESLLTTMSKYKGVKSAMSPFAAQATLTGEKEKVTAGQAQIATAKQQLAAAQTQLNTAKAQAEAAGQLAAVQSQFDAEQAKIDASTKTLDAQSTKLDLSSQLLTLAKNARYVSADGSAGLSTLSFNQSIYAVPAALKDKIVAKAENAGISGVNVFVSNDIAQGVPSVIGPGEIAGVIIAGIVLLVMLGTIIGAGLPLLGAIVGLGVSVLGAMAFSGIVQFTRSRPSSASCSGWRSESTTPCSSSTDIEISSNRAWVCTNRSGSLTEHPATRSSSPERRSSSPSWR